MIEIDQSGRIENTSMDSILAATNQVKLTVRISSQTKREVLSALRALNYEPAFIYLGMFSAGLFILLKTISGKSRLDVKIDLEYLNQDGNIRSLLKQISQSQKISLDNHFLEFGQIGRKSEAHELAIRTLRQESEANLELKSRQIVRLLVGKQKTG